VNYININNFIIIFAIITSIINVIFLQLLLLLLLLLFLSILFITNNIYYYKGLRVVEPVLGRFQFFREIGKPMIFLCSLRKKCTSDCFKFCKIQTICYN